MNGHERVGLFQAMSQHQLTHLPLAINLCRFCLQTCNPGVLWLSPCRDGTVWDWGDRNQPWLHPHQPLSKCHHCWWFQIWRWGPSFSFILWKAVGQPPWDILLLPDKSLLIHSNITFKMKNLHMGVSFIYCWVIFIYREPALHSYQSRAPVGQDFEGWKGSRQTKYHQTST